MSANTTLLVTPDFSRKSATFDKTVAIRESVQVTVRNAATYMPGGLVLAVVHHASLYASCQQWVASGADAVGTVSLNTTELVQRFNGSGDQACKQFTLMLVVILPETVLVNAVMSLMNAPYKAGMSVPTPCVPWGTDLSGIMADIAALQAAAANHAHDGVAGQGGQVNHGSLANIGGNTHAQIDAALLSHGARLSAHDGDIASLITRMGAAETGLSFAQDDIAALEAGTVAKGALGYTVGAGDAAVRAIDGGDDVSFNQLLQFVRTLAADLKTKGVI